MGPGSGNVAWCVAASAADEEGEVECLDEGDAGAVCADVEVEAAESVAAERVGAALEDDRAGAVGLDAGADDVLEELDVGVVVDAVVEGHVEGVVGTRVKWVIWTG